MRRIAFSRLASRSGSQRICTSPTVNGLATRIPSVSLANTEPAEDAVQQIVGIHGADHRAQRLQAAAQLQGQELRRILLQRHRVSAAQVFQTSLDVMPAPA